MLAVDKAESTGKRVGIVVEEEEEEAPEEVEDAVEGAVVVRLMLANKSRRKSAG